MLKPLALVHSAESLAAVMRWFPQDTPALHALGQVKLALERMEQGIEIEVDFWVNLHRHIEDATVAHERVAPRTDSEQGSPVQPGGRDGRPGSLFGRSNAAAGGPPTAAR